MKDVFCWRGKALNGYFTLTKRLKYIILLYKDSGGICANAPITIGHFLPKEPCKKYDF
jgi:hypothetical protein